MLFEPIEFRVTYSKTMLQNVAKFVRIDQCISTGKLHYAHSLHTV